jgi:hypothetical protein
VTLKILLGLIEKVNKRMTQKHVDLYSEDYKYLEEDNMDVDDAASSASRNLNGMSILGVRGSIQVVVLCPCSSTVGW